MGSLPITGSRVMMVVIANRGSHLDRTLLEGCENQYPNLKVQDDVFLHRLARDSGISMDQLFDPKAPLERYERLQGIHLLVLGRRCGDQDYLKIVN